MCRAAFVLFLALLFTSCQHSEGAKNTHKRRSNSQSKQTQFTEQHQRSLDTNLLDIQALNPQIQIELKYTVSDNFLGEKLYAKITKAYLQHDVAQRLSGVQEALEQAHPGYKLLIYDALRPVSVQQKMWVALDSLPPIERVKFVSNPKNLSLHNMGAAVDLTIVNAKGIPLDMGAGFDDIRQIAYPIYEDSFLRAGALTLEQVANRKLLRSLMQSQGFRQLPTEWWHYNACSREEAKKKYKVYQTEAQIFQNQ
jgi:zinc D-Ala-D-Ala dipeptidase